MPKIFKLNNKGVIHLIPLLLILAGIIGGVYLVQHPQIFKPKAYLKQIDPRLYQQRIDDMKVKFNIADYVDNEEAQRIIKEDLFKENIIIEGDIAEGDAQVSVTSECINGQQTNYDFSEYGVFPPICLTEEQKQKAVEFTLAGAESAADFIIPYSQAKKAIELGSEMDEAKTHLRNSGLAGRIQTSSISDPDSFFGGYIVTLIRIKELEEDVKQNPDGSGNLTFEQEEARREYVAALRNLWEKQHNLSIEVAGVVALSVIDKPLKVVGTFVKPVTGPVGSKLNQAKDSVGGFLRGAWEKISSKGAREAVSNEISRIFSLPKKMTSEEWEQFLNEPGHEHFKFVWSTEDVSVYQFNMPDISEPTLFVWKNADLAKLSEEQILALNNAMAQGMNTFNDITALNFNPLLVGFNLDPRAGSYLRYTGNAINISEYYIDDLIEENLVQREAAALHEMVHFYKDFEELDALDEGIPVAVELIWSAKSPRSFIKDLEDSAYAETSKHYNDWMIVKPKVKELVNRYDPNVTEDLGSLLDFFANVSDEVKKEVIKELILN